MSVSRWFVFGRATSWGPAVLDGPTFRHFCGHAAVLVRRTL